MQGVSKVFLSNTIMMKAKDSAPKDQNQTWTMIDVLSVKNTGNREKKNSTTFP